MRITTTSLQTVLGAVDVVDVVGEFVTLKRRGRNFLARCPFHDEKSPSFNVNQERGIYKCFGCGKAGDSVQFLQDLEGFSFVQAIEWLARRYNIELEYDKGRTDEDQAVAEARESLMAALTWASGYFRKQLTDSEEGRTIAAPYLKERGVTAQTQEAFNVGWALEGWDNLYKAATAAGYQPDVLEGAGLVLRRDDGSYTDRFRGRIMFPISTAAGRVVGFGGRTLVKDAKVAKYVNSPETEVYHKGRVLYGLYQSRQQIRKEDHVFLTEGYLDVIALHQAGIGRAVASSGTALTEEQATLIGRYAQSVTILFDGDAPGQKAAMRGLDILLAHGLAVRVLTLPDGHDPDSYLKKHGEQALLDYARSHEQDPVTYKVGALKAEAGDDPFRREAMIKDVVGTIALVEDPVRRQLLMREAARLLSLPEDTLAAEAGRITRQRSEQRKKEADRQARNRGEVPTAPPQPPGSMPPSTAWDDYDPSAEAPEGYVPPLPGEAGYGEPGPGIAPPRADAVPTANELLGALIQPLTVPEQVARYEQETLRILINYGEQMLTPTDGTPPEPFSTFVLRETEDIPFGSEPAATAMSTIRLRVSEGDLGEGFASHLLQHEDAQVRQLAQNLIIQPHYLSPRWQSLGIHVTEQGPSLHALALQHLRRLKLKVVRLRMEEAMNRIQHPPSEAEQLQALHDYMFYKAADQSLSAQLGTVMS